MIGKGYHKRDSVLSNLNASYYFKGFFLIYVHNDAHLSTFFQIVVLDAISWMKKEERRTIA